MAVNENRSLKTNSTNLVEAVISLSGQIWHRRSTDLGDVSMFSTDSSQTVSYEARNIVHIITIEKTNACVFF